MPEAAPATPATPAAPELPLTTPAAPATPAAPITALTAEPAKAPAEGSWPEEGFMPDWRERIAGNDEKKLAMLKRFTSPQTVADALATARRQLSEGKRTQVPAAEATPEQVAEYRKEVGIPEKPEDYFKDMKAADGTGIVIGEADKENLNSFAAEMHKQHASPQYVQAAAKFYLDSQAKQMAALQEENDRMRDETVESLMTEWGPSDFKGNKNAISNMLAGFSAEARAIIEQARDIKGIAIFNQPVVLKEFAKLARALNPSATIAPNAGGDVGAAVDSEIAAIRKLMANDDPAYYKDEKMQARYRELIAYKEGARAA